MRSTFVSYRKVIGLVVEEISTDFSTAVLHPLVSHLAFGNLLRILDVHERAPICQERVMKERCWNLVGLTGVITTST